MTPRFDSRLLWALILFALCCGLVAEDVKAEAVRPPNIVIFLADDLSLKDCSPYGGKDVLTPNMAALAREGLTFDRAYVASPSCAPSRAALLTGLYPARNGVMFNHQKARPEVRKWPSYFQALGYEVAAIGKVSHYGHVTTYGFDYADFYNYHQDVCVNKAVQWLAKRSSEKPLCLIVGTNWPHVPWPAKGALVPSEVNLPAKIADTAETRAARSRYAKAVQNADRDLGLVRDAARQHLPADTLFLFTSDHGSQFPFAKWNLYEAGLSTPMIAVWPGHIKPDQRTHAMVSWIDILPTMLAAAGANPEKAAPGIDGQSFLPVVLGQTSHHRDQIFATHSGDGDKNFYPSRAMREGDLKYIRNLQPSLTFHTHVDLAPQDTGYWGSWVREARSSEVIAAIIEKYHHRPAEELYDLSKDPNELVNLAVDPGHKADLRHLQGEMDGWLTWLQEHGSDTDAAGPPSNKSSSATPDP